MPLKHPRIDFSLRLKTTPALKGVAKSIPLGNKKGDFQLFLRSQKIFLG